MPHAQLRPSHFLTASYDGHLRFFDYSQKCVQDVPAHSAAITSITTVPNFHTNNDSHIVASASHDLTARLTKISVAADEAIPPQALASLHLHTSPLSSITSDSTGSMLLTASWDSLIGVWDTVTPLEDEVVVEDVERKKRRKMGNGAESYCKRKAPSIVLKLHTGRVSKALFTLNSQHTALSCGFDSTVRHWDVELGICKHTIVSFLHAKRNRTRTKYLLHSHGMSRPSQSDRC